MEVQPLGGGGGVNSGVFLQRVGGKFFDSAHMTFAYYIIAPGASVHATRTTTAIVVDHPVRTSVEGLDTRSTGRRVPARQFASGGVSRRP
jgi:hypothetical protein